MIQKKRTIAQFFDDAETNGLESLTHVANTRKKRRREYLPRSQSEEEIGSRKAKVEEQYERKRRQRRENAARSRQEKRETQKKQEKKKKKEKEETEEEKEEEMSGEERIKKRKLQEEEPMKDPVDKKIRSSVGGRLLRIARETSPELPIFLSSCVNIHLSSIQFMASLKRDNLTRYDIHIEEERIKRLKRGILITGYKAIEETETDTEPKLRL